MECTNCGNKTTNVLRTRNGFAYVCEDCQKLNELERRIFEECLKIFPEKTVILEH